MTLGTILKEARNKHKFSLEYVQKESGITNSRLSRAERESGTKLYGDEIKKLADLYGIDVVNLYLKAGYLSNDDLMRHQLVFKNAELLTDEEIQCIQTQINLMTKERGL